MADPLHLEESRTIPAPTEVAWPLTLTTPLEQIFDRRFWAIPPIKGVRGQEGEWGTVGQSRTILLADGGTMQERLTEVVEPRHFGYEISQVTGPMKPLVAAAEGRWSFAPDGEGTRVTWAWTVHPRRFAAPLMPVFAWLWHGSARQALARLEELAAR